MNPETASALAAHTLPAVSLGDRGDDLEGSLADVLTDGEREAIEVIRRRAEARRLAATQMAPANNARRAKIDADAEGEKRFIDLWVERLAPGANADRTLIGQLYHTGFKNGAIEGLLAGIEPAPIRWASAPFASAASCAAESRPAELTAGDQEGHADD